jgi:hypothetical protein
VASGKKIGIQRAPTRWGNVSFSFQTSAETKALEGHIEFLGTKVPQEVHLKLRLPNRAILRSVIVNGRSMNLSDTYRDTIVIKTAGIKKFELSGQWS